jgi:competence protein ComEC
MPPSKTLFTTGNMSSKPKLIVDIIDVGQGNCVLISFPGGGFMLVDAGSQTTSQNSKPFKHASQYITTVTGGNPIDCVVLTHGDSDHTAFIPYITEAQQPTYVHYSGTPKNYDDDVVQWIKKMEGRKKLTSVFRFPGDYFDLNPDADFGSETIDGEAHVYVLSANHGSSPNDKSIVLMIIYGNQGVILPGDAEFDTEAFILSRIPKAFLKRCTLLMPGHHGAYESTSTEWANTLQPTVAAISASGANMAYAHPNCATTELLAKKVSNNAENHSVVCSTGKSQPYQKVNTTRALAMTATQGDVRWISDGVNAQVKASSLISAKEFGAVPQFETPLERLGRLEREGNFRSTAKSLFRNR